MIENGLYQIKRSDAVTIGETKTLTCYPYNQAEATMTSLKGDAHRDFIPSWSWHPAVTGFWGTLDPENFVQDNQMSYLVAYRADGYARFLFEDPPAFPEPTFEVEKIALCAYIRGRGKTVIRVDGSDYYGAETSDGWVFDWLETEYTLNPKTGVAWHFSDLQGINMSAGIWLASSGMDWDAIVSPKAACRYFKYKLYYKQNNTPPIPADHYVVEYWPNNYDYTDLDPFVGNILYGTYPHYWDSYATPIYVYHPEAEEPNDDIYYTQIYDLPPIGETINSLRLDVAVGNTDPSEPLRLFVKIGENYYYGDTFNTITSGMTGANYTWSVNPETSAAWTRDELATVIIGYGLESGTFLPIRTYDFYPTISYGDPAASLIAACISSGPGMVVPCIPKLEACLSQYGPNEFELSNETYYNGIATKVFSFPVVAKPTSGTIDSISITYKIGRVPTTGDWLQSYYKTHLEFPQEEFYYGGEVTTLPTGMSPEYTETWTTNPKTGVAWTLADLVDLKFGITWRHDWPAIDVPGSYGASYTGKLQTYILKLDISYNSGSLATTDAADDQLWGNPILFTCDLSELPPRGSTVNSITLNYEFGGISGEGVEGYRVLGPMTNVSTMAAWIYQDGVYYFDDDVYVGDPFALKGDSKTWLVNPSTGLPFVYEDLSALKFGVIMRNSNESGSASAVVYGHITKLNLVIGYNEAIASDPVNYRPIDLVQIISLTRSQQTPITHDVLKFSTSSRLPDRTEIALFDHGVMRFHGIVTGTAEVIGANEFTTTAKSQSVMLDYRYIPTYSYAPILDAFDQVFTIRDQFSADIPLYPFAQNNARQSYVIGGDEEYKWHEGGIEFTQLHQTHLGIVWLINSMVLPGSATSHNSHVAKLSNFAGRISGRALFTTNHCPSPMPNGWYEYYLMSADGETWGYQNYADSQSKPDYIGGVHRLAMGASAGLLNPGEYIVVGDDVYYHTGGYPDNLLFCIDGAFDTWLRPGDWELEDHFLNVANSFAGQASESFDTFFESLGQEIQFRNDLDGNVYIDAATEMSRGSESDPIRSFVHGERNCSIVVKEADGPQPDAIIAQSENTTQLVTTWAKPKGAWLTRFTSDSTRSSEDLRTYLAVQLGEDKTLYEITILETNYELLPGDWISVTPKRRATKSVRIQSITNTPGKTKIIAGRIIHTISSKFGEWRDALGTADLTKCFQTKEFSFTGASGSSSFVIHADKCIDWSCRLSVSLQTAEGTAPQDLMYRIALNGKIIPPGRYAILDNNSTIDMDITDFCIKSTAADTTNTIAVYLDGGTVDNTVTATVNQYKTVKELSNA